VNTAVVEVVRGADRKLYSARPLSHVELNQRRWLAHNLVHRDGLSIRQAQRTMRESYGIRRSVGAIHGDLKRFECQHCADE
jgi:hypothetical protein